MDANNQNFHMLADGSHFDFSKSNNACIWDDKNRILKLNSQRAFEDFPSDRAVARLLANNSPSTVDGYDTWAILNEDRSQVIALGAFSESTPIYVAPTGQRIFDISMGDDEVLYIAVGIPEVNSSIVMLDRLDRWKPVSLKQNGFNPDRVVTVPGKGAFTLDRSNQKLAQIKGMPLRDRPRPDYCPGTARPCEENSDPPRINVRNDLIFPNNREVVAMSSNFHGKIAFLLWHDTPTEKAEIMLMDDNSFVEPVKLGYSGAPFTIGWVEDDKWAVLFDQLNEAIVYDLSGSSNSNPINPAGDRYPLSNWNNTLFCNSLEQPVNYLSNSKNNLEKPRPLYKLSMPGLAQDATVSSQSPFDSGENGTIWHRIYLEASLPPGTGLKIFLYAADDTASLASANGMEHCFGSCPRVNDSTDIPIGTWVTDSSEIPFHPGLLHCKPKENHAGLFTVLVQRPGRKVRSLAGRYLKIDLQLFGNGQSGPEVAAVRIYGPRFSYLDNYLPELYRETEFGAKADTMDKATGADFLQRFLGIFEGMLTPLEDKIASSYLVTDPVSAPSDALDWLGTWIGMSFESGLPTLRKRKMLAHATELYRKRGTIRGLSGALNIATDNKVALGQIVILEDFRLRRTFATILGADLADEENPLTAGIVSSGNSYVGDTLFLGDEEKMEFLALFKPDILENKKEKKIVKRFFEKLANKITILIHNETNKETFKLIKRIAELEIPAHVSVRVLKASDSLLVGLSAIVGLDTYMGKRKPPKPAKIGKSFIGRGDYIKGMASLDPRLEGAASPVVKPGMRRPTANAGDDSNSEYGSNFTLDGSRSGAYDGRNIDHYLWRWLQ